MGGSDGGRRGSSGATEETERCSKDSATLTVSDGDGAMWFGVEGDEGSPPSESDTEWKEEIDEAGAWREGDVGSVRPRVIAGG